MHSGPPSGYYNPYGGADAAPPGVALVIKGVYPYPLITSTHSTIIPRHNSPGCLSRGLASLNFHRAALPSSLDFFL